MLFFVMTYWKNLQLLGALPPDPALAKSISPLANANKTRVGLIETSQALGQMANKNS